MADGGKAPSQSAVRWALENEIRNDSNSLKKSSLHAAWLTRLKGQSHEKVGEMSVWALV
jgi:hypothetical protein